MPRSACARAGASLTPSPTVATCLPSSCRRHGLGGLVAGEDLGDDVVDDESCVPITVSSGLGVRVVARSLPTGVVVRVRLWSARRTRSRCKATSLEGGGCARLSFRHGQVELGLRVQGSARLRRAATGAVLAGGLVLAAVVVAVVVRPRRIELHRAVQWSFRLRCWVLPPEIVGGVDVGRALQRWEDPRQVPRVWVPSGEPEQDACGAALLGEAVATFHAEVATGDLAAGGRLRDGGWARPGCVGRGTAERPRTRPASSRVDEQGDAA